MVDTTPPAIKELIYSDPQADVLETTADRVLFLAGVGSGKSQVIGVLSYEFVINNPEMIGFIGANTYNQLAKSTLNRVFHVWENEFDLIKDVDYVVDHIPPKHFKKFGPDLKSYENVISFQNGAKIFIASLDNYKAIDGVELGWACLDETKDTKEEAVKEVIIARLRQKGMYINPKTGAISKELKPGYQGYNPLFIFTSPAKTKWLSDWFGLDDDAEEITSAIFTPGDYYRKRKGRQLVVISSTYHNEHNLPPGYIQGMIDDLAGNEGLIDMLIFGSPFGKSGGEFCTTYSRMKHVKEFEYWPELPVHLSFDFNAVPYMTCTLWQMKFDKDTNRWLVRCIDEMCLKNPKNDSESLSYELETYYGNLMKNGLFYYGDYSGNNETTVSKNLKSNYKAIESILGKYMDGSSKRVIKNQSLEKRRRFINKLFKGAFPIDIELNVKCKELRSDLEFCKEGPDGGKLKSIVKIDDRSFQDRGHCLDSLEYFFTSAFDYLFAQ